MADKNDIVMINLDRPRMLWFGHKALKKLGALTGKEIDSMMDMNNLDLEELETIFYCALITDAERNKEELKLEQMEDLLDMVPFGELVGKLQDAFQAAFGNMEDVNSQKNLNRIVADKKKKK